ncbi:hypothetical protein BU24DRAFT_427071, partial [Aaosphaeria arxii CBS 175.79]
MGVGEGEVAGTTTEHWDGVSSNGSVKDDYANLEDYLQRQPDLEALDIAPDLPDQLAMMDMEALLPKLPAIPAPPPTPFMRMGQKMESGVFGTQAQVDALLHSQHTKDVNSVDMFVRCTMSGSVHPSVYDSLETVTVGLPGAWDLASSRAVLHASHPYSCSHVLLTEVKKDAETRLAVVPLTLGFIPSAGVYLHLIASKTSQLQNLLLYVEQSLQRIRTFWKHSMDLPGKFMRNISETLEEKGQGNLVQNLFHLACTGHCPDLVREWLVDELTQAGNKRWENTVSSSLATIMQLVHESLLPALDRCSLTISRLRGLAEYHDVGWIFSAPTSSFTSLLTQLQNLRLLAHTTLHYVADERRQFQAFNKWLHFVIDLEDTEPESQSRAEMLARDAGVDTGLVLEYIEYSLSKSDTAPYLRPEAELSSAQREMGPATYEDTKKAVELLKEGASYKEEALCLEHVFRHLNAGCTQLFQQISQWQEANISMDCGVVLESSATSPEGDHVPLDMRMVYDPTSTQPDQITTYVATSSPTHPSHLQLHRLTHTSTITTLPQSLHAYSTSTLDFSPATIIDAKFADDKALLILLQLPFSTNDDSENVLISLPYALPPSSPPKSTPKSNSPPQSTPRIQHTPFPAPSYGSHLLPTGTPPPPSSRTTTVFSPADVSSLTRHVFDARFAPLKLVV